MKTLRLALLALVCCSPLLASAQWQWLDKDGRKVFSDQPPPADVPANRILRQPGGKAVAPPAEQVPAATPAVPPVAAASANMPKVTGKDPELERKKKLAEAAEAEKRKVEEERFQVARADNCKRATSSKAALDAGGRIARTNEKGEREILDDAQRAAETRRVEAIMARDCK
jgi:hypothetical protein